MNPFEKLFRKTFPAKPARDNDGRYLPHRIECRKKALEMAKAMNRDDLIARLNY